MADKHDAEHNAEQTRLTLEQLSQTLEVMSHVVERLRQHLDRQLSLTAELFGDEDRLRAEALKERRAGAEKLREESLVVEISHRELEEGSDHKVH